MDEESIRVLGRFRPISSSEKTFAAKEGLVDVPPVFINSQRVKLARTGEKAQTFTCSLDAIFSSEVTQREIFEQVGKPIVDTALQGYNATIFCYGQSGAGKSFTMFGPEPSDIKRVYDKELNGIVPRCIEYLLECLTDRVRLSSAYRKSGDEDMLMPIKDWKVSVEFIQIYKTDLLDLLDARSDKKLRIRQNFQTDTTQVENLSKMSINTIEDFSKLLNKAISNRVTAKHALNAVSSRSHMLVMLSVEQQMPDASLRTSRLNFGDLAGSEDVAKALGPNPDPERLKEAIAINSSLSALTTAISMLSRGQKASFRSSPLTHILQDSLGGNSKTTMVVNASPHIRNREETVRTLRFAQTAKKVKNKAKVNDRLTRAQLEQKILELEAENARLKGELVQWEHQAVVVRMGSTKQNTGPDSPLQSPSQTSITSPKEEWEKNMITLDTYHPETPSMEIHVETVDDKDNESILNPLKQNDKVFGEMKPRYHQAMYSVPHHGQKMSILDIAGGRPHRSGSHAHAISAPFFNRNDPSNDGESTLTSLGLSRHASLTTGMAIIQPHEASTLLGMKVLREEIEKSSRLLKKAQEDCKEYAEKNVQLEREVEALQNKLRDNQEKTDKLENFLHHFNESEIIEPTPSLIIDSAPTIIIDSTPSILIDTVSLTDRTSLTEIKSEEEQEAMIDAPSSTSVIIHPCDTFLSLSLSQPHQPSLNKNDPYLLELQKDLMKLRYLNEMQEEKINDLTQQLLVVETLLDTNDENEDNFESDDGS